MSINSNESGLPEKSAVSMISGIFRSEPSVIEEVVADAQAHGLAVHHSTGSIDEETAHAQPDSGSEVSVEVFGTETAVMKLQKDILSNPAQKITHSSTTVPGVSQWPDKPENEVILPDLPWVDGEDGTY
jgi:hypothetical protein